MLMMSYFRTWSTRKGSVGGRRCRPARGSSAHLGVDGVVAAWQAWRAWRSTREAAARVWAGSRAGVPRRAWGYGCRERQSGEGLGRWAVHELNELNDDDEQHSDLTSGLGRCTKSIRASQKKTDSFFE
jgi:hypothetical protein